MENTIKVAVVKIRTVEAPKACIASDNDVYPFFLTATTTFKVYLSEDISSDMSVALYAVKEITDKTTTESFALTAEGPCVDTEDSKKFSKELSLQAVGLLSSALPQYEFKVAEYAYELKYEIKQNNKGDVVKGRLKAMKCLFWAIIISSIIPYRLVPWASYMVVSVYMMFFACVLYCLLAWLISRMVNAGRIAISIGVAPDICLYRFKTADVFCGPVPFPDVAMPASVISHYYKSWTIAIIPPILMSLIGYAFVYYRNYLFETSPDAVAGIVQCHTYSVAAIFSLSCFLTAGAALMLYFEKSKGIYPQRALMFTFMQYAIVITGIMEIYRYSDELLNLIGL